MKLNCFVIDDEPLAVKLIEAYVQKTPFLELKGHFADALTALTAINQEKVDLIFLDIQMPELNGIKLSKMISGDTRIIFTTAFQQYALDSYKVNALDYLLKPISYADFISAANKALQWFELLRQTNDTKSIFIKTDRKQVQVKLDDILFMEGMKDYIKIYLENADRPLLTLMTMKSMEESLPTSLFKRVHRSFIVNLSKIEVIENNRILIKGHYIPVTQKIG